MANTDLLGFLFRSDGRFARSYFRSNKSEVTTSDLTTLITVTHVSIAWLPVSIEQDNSSLEQKMVNYSLFQDSMIKCSKMLWLSVPIVEHTIYSNMIGPIRTQSIQAVDSIKIRVYKLCDRIECEHWHWNYILRLVL